MSSGLLESLSPPSLILGSMAILSEPQVDLQASLAAVVKTVVRANPQIRQPRSQVAVHLSQRTSRTQQALCTVQKKQVPAKLVLKRGIRKA